MNVLQILYELLHLTLTLNLELGINEFMKVGHVRTLMKGKFLISNQMQNLFLNSTNFLESIPYTGTLLLLYFSGYFQYSLAYEYFNMCRLKKFTHRK